MHHEKTGPELLTVTPELLQGIETLASIYKHNHDEHNYNFMTLTKTVLSKYPVMVKECHHLASKCRDLAADLLKVADFAEQIFPK